MENGIRLAELRDSEAMLHIYKPYVETTSISFETVAPTPAQFAARIEEILQTHPCLVYLADGEVAGYAYASVHRARAAYRYNADLSVYLAPQYHGSGAAARLCGCLFELLRALGYYNVYAAVTLPNEKSIRFHEKCGFTLIGVHHNTGYKFGQWHDVAWLEKALAPHEESPAEPKRISELSVAETEAVLARYNG